MRTARAGADSMAALLLLVTAAAASLGDLSRRETGDIFTLLGGECGATQCAEHGAGSSTSASAVAEVGCACVCPQRAPLFREDRELCVDDLPECSLATFGSGSGIQRIPFVYLPLKGQIIHPSREITFPNVKTPICAVSGAQYLTRKGFIDLRNTLDADVPLSLFRDEGRTFLQWTGEDEVRTRMTGRVMVVRLLCRDVATMPSSPLDLRGVFTPCVAFRVQGAPPKHTNNITEVQFTPNAQTSEASHSSGLTILEYVAIGVSSLLLGLVYVASVFLYLHIKKRRKATSNEAGLRRLKALKTNGGSPITERDIIRISNERAQVLQNAMAQDSGVIKKNPLLTVGRLFHDTKNFSSDFSDSEDMTDSGPHSMNLFNNSTTSVVIHQHTGELRKKDGLEINYRDEPNIERLPDEHVSIVETIDDREIARPVGTTRRKLYFNPAYFEPHLMADPPAAALEFLSKIREVIAIAKQKMATKRFQPILNEIPEEETYPSIDNSIDLSHRFGSQRSESLLSLKRENSRKKSVNCLGCPGCQSTGNNGIEQVLYKPVACTNCQTANGDKQNSIREWLENIPNGKQPLFYNETLLKTNQSNLATSLLSLPLPANQPNQKLQIHTVKSLESSADDYVPPKKVRSRSIRSEPGSRNYNLPSPEFNCVDCSSNSKNCRATQAYEVRPTPVGHRGGSLRHSMETHKRIRNTLMINRNRNSLPDMVNEAIALENFSKSTYNISSSDEEKTPKPMPRNEIESIFTRNDNSSPTVHDYETDSLERTSNQKDKGVSNDFSDFTSSQASPSLSNALPLEEELTMRNEIYKPNSSGNSQTPSPEADICDQNHYETIDTAKASNKNETEIVVKAMSLVTEVYVNNYNFGSAPTSPSGSECSMGSRKMMSLENFEEKPGCLTIEVRDPPENYIKIHESDDFEPDTLDRKHPKNEHIVENISFGRKNLKKDTENIKLSIQLRSSGTFSKSNLNINEHKCDSDEEHYKQVFNRPRQLSTSCNGSKSLDYINDDTWEETNNWTSEEGRILTLELRHSKRQRQCTPPTIKQLKNLARPDILPPLPPINDSPIYEKPTSPPRRVRSEVLSPELKPLKLSLNKKPYSSTESDDNFNSCPVSISTDSQIRASSKSSNSDYEEIKHIDTRPGLIVEKNGDEYCSSTEKILENNCFGNLVNTNTFIKGLRSVNSAKPKLRRKKGFNIDDSGYLSSDSTSSKPVNSKSVPKRLVIAKIISCSESDDTENEARSESGAESVETHSVYFGSFRNLESKDNNIKSHLKNVRDKRRVKQ